MIETKPKWFYDWIGMISKFNHELAITLLDAMFIDEVSAFVKMQRRMYEWEDYDTGRIERVGGDMKIHIILQDAPPPYVKPRFEDKHFDYVDVISFTYWVKEIIEPGRYKAGFCFRDIYEDQWYLINPKFLYITDKPVSWLDW